MKLFFVSIAVLLTGMASAQSKEPDMPLYSKPWTFKALPHIQKSPLREYKTLILSPSYKLSPGVHFLPQDGMPCLVPANPVNAVIPNLWNGTLRSFKGTIPNPALPGTKEKK